MLSKTLSFNRGVIVQATRSVGWIGLVYFILLLFALPLQLLMAHSREDSYYHDFYLNRLDSLFGVIPGFQYLLMFTVPVLLSIFVFRYMQTKLSADYMHSLPIKRESLFHQYIAFSSVMLLVPLMLTGIILFLLRGYLEAQALLSLVNIAEWIGITIMMNLFVFFIGVFVAMLTGMSVLQAALIYILFVFPAGITMLYFMNLKYYLFGMNVNFHLTNNLEQLVPFIRIAGITRNPFSVTEIFGFILITVICYVIALLVYRKRNTEAATQAISLRPLRPVFLYGVTVSTMLLAGLYFGETQNHSLGWILFGYIVGSLFGYIVAQIILQKTWRVFDKWKGYLGFAIVAMFAGFMFHLDVTGYENRIPAAENIERVYFADSTHYLGYYNVRHAETWTDSHGKKFGERDFYFDSPEMIERIQQFHQQLVSDKADLKNKYPRGQTVSIIYELSNDKEVAREYRIPINSYEQFYQPIIDSDEYKYNFYPLLRINDISKLDSITFSSHQVDRRVVISDRDKLAEIHAILQSEMLNETTGELLKHSEPWGNIEYQWQGNRYFSISWKKTYDEIDAWLVENGLLEQARYTAADISHALVYKNDGTVLAENYRKTDPYLNNLENDENVQKIEDNEQLEQLMRLTSWDDRSEAYVVLFYFNTMPYPNRNMIPVNQAPDFIKN